MRYVKTFGAGLATLFVLAFFASACASGGDEVITLKDAQSRTILQLHDEVSTLEDEVFTLKANLDEEKNRAVVLDRTIEIQDELIEQIKEDRDTAFADLATAEKESEATAASVPTTTVADNTQWCLDYKLSLEVAGEEKARNTLVSPFDPNAYHYSMNRGMYIDWVAQPLADAGCPVPRGYLAP